MTGKLRGRVVSRVFMLVMPTPVGSPTMGSLADRIGDSEATAIFGPVSSIALLLLLAVGWRDLREL